MRKNAPSESAKKRKMTMLDALLLVVGALIAFSGGGMIVAPRPEHDWDEVWGVCVVLLGILLICIAADSMLP